MNLIDTNILSTFALVGRLDLLIKVFGKLSIAEEVFNEVKKASSKGYAHAQAILERCDGESIEILTPTVEERNTMKTLPLSFGDGERGSIAIAKHRSLLFASNEKRVLNYGKREGIGTISLNSILRYLWEEKVLTKEETKALMLDMEAKDNLVITSKEEILDES